MPPKGFVYTLTDPRDGTIRYVGKTTKSLQERLAGHLASPTNPAMRLWISTLSAQRLVPVITMVAAVPQDRLSATEERYIRRHAEAGHRLFNAPYYTRHFGDLTPSAPVSAERPPSAAVHTRHRGVRCLIYMVVVGSYLWCVGFDVLVRREVLPRLPVAEFCAFWHAYLARPVSAMALHAAVVLAVWLLAACLRWRKARKQPEEVIEDPGAAAARALRAALDAEAP